VADPIAGNRFGPRPAMTWQRLLPSGLLLLAAAAVVLRVPGLVLEPRFWAEEARVYFVYALAAGPLDALTAPHQGYYSLVPNLATWLATLVPLETAPAVTTAMALAVQVLPALIAATSTAPWAQGPARRTAAVLVVLLVGAAGELHATTTNSQFHLALAAGLVYLDFAAGPAGSRRRALLAVLVLGGLTGVQATLLTPAFAWRWWRERRPADRAAMIVLGLCLALQAGVVILAPAEADRFAVALDPAKALGRAAERLAKGLLVYPVAGGLGPKTLALPLGWVLAAIGGLGVVAAAVAQVAILRRGPGRDLLAAAWLVAVVSFVGSRRMAGGDRYLALPAALIVLAILAVAFDRRHGRPMRLAAGLAVAAAILSNAWLYLPRMDGMADPGWPAWRDEVAAWRAGDRAEPRVHPQWADGVWTVPLPEALRPR